MTDDTPDLMTAAEAFEAAQSSFLTAEQAARKAMEQLQGRNEAQHALATSIESLAYGLKVLTAALAHPEGDSAGDDGDWKFEEVGEEPLPNID